MSVRPTERKNLELQRQEDKVRTNISNIIDNINYNNLNVFYPKEDSLFKKRIDKLNYKFYIETEKYLTSKIESEKNPDKLFVILFKQISLYIEEVERLNLLLKEKVEGEKTFKEKIEELNKKERDKSVSQTTILNLRNLNKTLEKKLEDKNKSKEKLKLENESLQRQLRFYKEQMETNLNKNKQDNKIKKLKNLEENINNSTVIKDSNMKIISISVNPEKEMTRSNNSNTNLNKIDSSGSFHSGSINKTLTQSKIITDEINVSKIINKKRNYSDNNPKKEDKENNMIQNLRYKDKTLIENISSPGKIEFNKNSYLKREITKSFIGKNSSIVKSPDKNEKNEKNNFSAVSVKINKVENNNNSINKQPLPDGKIINISSSKNNKDLKIIKSVKLGKINKKTELLNEPDLDHSNISNYGIFSPKGVIVNKLSNSQFDTGLNSFSNNNSNSTNDFIQLQENYVNNFNSFDEELSYLQELEKMLRNTKIIFNSGIEKMNSIEKSPLKISTKSNINKTKNTNSNTQTKTLINYKRSDSLQSNNIFFSDDDIEGYKSGTSVLSDKNSTGTNFFGNKIRVKSQLSVSKEKNTLSNNLSSSSNNHINNVSSKNKLTPLLLNSVTIDLMDDLNNNIINKKKSESLVKIKK